MRYKTKATPEQVADYEKSAEDAEKRIPVCERLGRQAEADQWAQMASYCRMMAACRTMNDDETEGQRMVQMTINFHQPEDLSKPIQTPPSPWLLRTDDLRKGNLREAEWLALELALGYLSTREKVCFVAKFGGGLALEEIGRALGISSQQALVHLKRAEKKMETKAHPLAWMWKAG
jgi:DNA-directed RNA polymerase specialized sigma24 family protein